jgi:putative redox protein
MVKATVRLTGATGYQTEIVSGSHRYLADEPADKGGTDTGPTPSQMAMGALGACIAITLRMYAERKKWPLEGVEIALDFERFAASDYAAYSGDELFVHEVRESIRLIGTLDATQTERLMDIATKCPVRRLIATPSFFVEELLDEEGEA